MSPRSAWAVAIVATLTTTVSYIDRQALAALSPSLTNDLHITETGFGVIGAMFSVAYIISTPIAGWWIDQIGARRGLVRSLLAWSLVSALQTMVPGIGTLLVVRFALGLAEGPGFPGAAQAIQRVLPEASRERGYALLFMGSSIGSMVAPQLALWLQGELDTWRAAFLATSLIGLAWIPLWLIATRRADVRARLDIAVPAAVRVPPPPFRVLAVHPIMVRALIAIFACAPLVGFVFGWGTRFLVKQLGVPKLEPGHYLWLPPLAFDVAALLFGDLAARRRRRRGNDGSPPLVLFAIAAALGCMLVALPLVSTPWQATATMAVALAGGGAMYTLVTADLLARMPAEAIAHAGGILAGAQSLALIIVSPLIGVAYDHFGTYNEVAVALGAWVVPGALLWIVWRPALRFAPAI